MAKDVEVKDLGWNKLVRRLTSKQLQDGKAASVGVQGVKAEEVTANHNEMTNVGIAVVNEFGEPSVNIPPRPHWRPTFDENQAKYEKELARIAKTIFDPSSGTGDMAGALKLLGEMYRADVIKKIDSSIQPELAEWTKATRGGETIPLRVTGEYVGSFSTEIVDSKEKQRS